MKYNDEIFRAYDIRGIYPSSLSEEIVEGIGKALGSRIIRQNLSSIAIGRDGRLSSPALSKALIKGLISCGCKVFDIGLVPTPLVYYAGKKLADGCCIAITGSHNPANYNGLKMVINRQTLATNQIQRLKPELNEENFCENIGSQQSYNIEQDYIDEIIKQSQLKKSLKVVIDAGNGVAGEIAPKLLRQLGCEVIELYCQIDGHFPNHHPDPSKPENLKELIDKVIESKADIGIAYDGDGDRIGVVDNQGTIINADRLMMLFAQQVLQENPKAEILFDVKCSSHLQKWIEKFGGKATMCRTGHSFVKKALQESNAHLAGEMSGHIFFNDRWYGFDDALYSTVRLLEILSNSTLDSAEQFAKLPDSVNTPELNIDTREGENFEILEKLKKRINFPEAIISTIDGLRVDFPNGWGLVRPSNTTPMLVLRFEADNQKTLEQIQYKFRQMLTPLCSNPLPF